jgi:hypothetical protein
VHACVASNRAFSVLRELTATQASGPLHQDNQPAAKDVYLHPDSMKNAFQLCASKGAWSLPHRDRHYTVTCVTVEHGRKLWVIWPRVDSIYDDWVAGQHVAPRLCDPFAILLRAGDTLIQPAGSVHGPYTLEPTLITGSFHWDSRDIVCVPQQTLKDRTNNYQSNNEDEAPDLISRLTVVERAWKEQNPAYPWPSAPGSFQAFTSSLRVCSPSLVPDSIPH